MRQVVTAERGRRREEGMTEREWGQLPNPEAIAAHYLLHLARELEVEPSMVSVSAPLIAVGHPTEHWVTPLPCGRCDRRY
jgi:hypothetical protein